MLLFELANKLEENLLKEKYWKINTKEKINKLKFSDMIFQIFEITRNEFGNPINIKLQDLITKGNYTIYNDEKSFWVDSEFKSYY